MTGCVPQKPVVWEVESVSEVEIVDLEKALIDLGYEKGYDDDDVKQYVFSQYRDIHATTRRNRNSVFEIAFSELFVTNRKFTTTGQKQLERFEARLRSMFDDRLKVVIEP